MAGLKKSEKMLMSVAGAMVVVFVINQFVCGKQAGPAPENAPAPQPQVSESPRKPAGPSPSRRPLRRRSEVTFTGWGRDPFAEAFLLAEFDSSATDSSDFVLKGVIWRGDEAYVLIGNAILKKGERRGDLVVLDIQKDRVVCQKRNRIVTLLLRPDDEK